MPEMRPEDQCHKENEVMGEQKNGIASIDKLLGDIGSGCSEHGIGNALVRAFVRQDVDEDAGNNSQKHEEDEIVTWTIHDRRIYRHAHNGIRAIALCRLCRRDNNRRSSTARILGWLGFMMPLNIGAYLWENKPFKLFALNTAHYLVSLIVMAAILAVWV
jgi:hypothetical protein